MRNYDFDLEAQNDFDVTVEAAPSQPATRTLATPVRPTTAPVAEETFAELLKQLTAMDNFVGPLGSRAEQRERAAKRRALGARVHLMQQGEAAPVPTPSPLPSWRTDTEQRLALILDHVKNHQH